MQFRLLGPLQVLGDGASPSLGQPKQRALLGLLLLRRGRFVSRQELIEALWGERPPRSAVGSLHVYVHGLRQVLGPERIEARGTAYRIRLEPGELDVERFEDLLEQARSGLADGAATRAAGELDAALGLWRGPVLAGLPPELLRAERAHLDEIRLSALELQIEADLRRGDPDRAIARVSTLIAEHPFRERLREQQILALYRAGRQKDALEAYRRARDVLVEELGIEPGPRLRDLESAILRQEPELDPAPGASGLGGAATPAEASEAASSVAAASLPAPPTALVGRGREVGEIEALFAEDRARLVTLTGPGGTGKTRLALAAAERISRGQANGARFVDLSAISEPDLLLPAVADSLEVPPGPSALSALSQYLRPLGVLLVLDNLEHLVSAATALSDLLTAAPGLLILATSRVPLRLRAEHEYPVPGLAPPGPNPGLAAIAASDAVQLLVERSRAVNRACTLTEESAGSFAQICRRLDGLPLALELAASRMRTRSPAEVAAGLHNRLELLVEGPRDLPPRQRTLRATLDWSYELLGPEERRVFSELAALSGSFETADVAAVSGRDTDEALAELVEANLVRRLASGRFTMLQTVREYAAERLRHGGHEAAARGRHGQHFLGIASRAEQAIMAGEHVASAYRTLDQAHDNLRAALGWAEQEGEMELQVRLACTLRQFWLVRGDLTEGRRFFEQAVRATEGADPTLRAQALMHGGPFLYRQGALAQARAWWEEALMLLKQQNDVAGAARCAGELGAVAFSEGELDRAAELYAQSAEGFASLDDRLRLGIVSANLAEITALRGDVAGAIPHAEQAVASARELEDVDGLALALHTLARLRGLAGDREHARRLFAECLGRAREIGYREVIANCVQAAAELGLEAGGEPERSMRLLGVAQRTLGDMGVRVQGLEDDAFRRTKAVLVERIGVERVRAIEQEARDVGLEQVIDDALEVLGGERAAAPVEG